MRFLDDFRNREKALHLSAEIAAAVEPGRRYGLMEFCGGHTHAIFRYGLMDLVPEDVTFLHGPGCPVCVLPASRIQMAIELAEAEGVILCTYGDVMRVPAKKGTSLITAKAKGADVRMVYSITDALRLAHENPEREVVFLAIGFETTTPPSAVAILHAAAEGLTNFSILCNHLLTPAVIRFILESAGLGVTNASRIDGFLGPSHVSAVIGAGPYAPLAQAFNKPVVVAGFEPLDVLQSTLMLVRQANRGTAKVENQYTRVVSQEGNLKAQQIVERVFEKRGSFEWRGLGEVPDSSLQLKQTYLAYDAEHRFALSEQAISDVKGCACPAILRGEKKPTDCKLFGTVCTPDNPRGACMVSSEGACAAYWSYGRVRHEHPHANTSHH
ncbi:hydrogenase formation protein HypD [Pseudovibrio sp. Tun.PSC04-5.I4]|uniref:hydrogenase formation protein HypD n=1 Tax=Pseudovibrio sp. Tun.PSC04-5.I4 TaxID=1798213 RepID=UPI00087E3A33|nr:hydrogenase formation protein HypD [Pseudovibrio sp. Tun.PSC04-5.I4]SDQ12078.1 hydrogenase expression/formation protein HypD [Pseudovibrio sp. Tun.PSC04-5.I4]